MSERKRKEGRRKAREEQRKGREINVQLSR